MTYCECCDENEANICWGCSQDGVQSARASRDWTSVRDALPPQEGPICGFSHTAHVLVSNGYNISLAYLKRWDDDEDYPDVWKEVGRSGYDVAFEVLYWRALPQYPEIPTGE